MSESILEQTKRAASQRLLFLPHTIRQMSRPDRMISTGDVEEVIRTGEVRITLKMLEAIAA